VGQPFRLPAEARKQEAKLDRQALLNLLLDRGNPLASAATGHIIHAEKAA
jgi:hypothetical protein